MPIVFDCDRDRILNFFPDRLLRLNVYIHQYRSIHLYVDLRTYQIEAVENSVDRRCWEPGELENNVAVELRSRDNRPRPHL